MPNQQIRTPFGDSFIIGTPHIDQLSNQLYQEQKQREAYKQQQAKELNDEFLKVLPGVRSPDVNKAADLWSNFKSSWMQLQKNPPKDQKEYINAQRGLMSKKAQFFQHVADSKELSQEEKGMGGTINQDKTGRLIDQAHSILKQGMNTPLGQPLTITGDDGKQTQINDWTDQNNYLRHVDTKGVMDADKASQGDKNSEYIGEKSKPTDLQMPKIKAGNNPFDYYNNMLVYANAKPTDFLNTLPHPSDDEYHDKEIQYNNLDPAIKKMWKMNDDLPDDDKIRTPIERAIKYQAMTYGLNPNKQPRVTGYQDDKALITANNNKFKIEQQKRGADFAMDRVGALLKEKRTLDNEDDFKGIASILNNTKDVINSGTSVKDPVGNDDPDVVNVSDFTLLKSLTNIKGYKPDNVTFDKKKDQFNVHYDAKDWVDKGGNKQHIDPEDIPVSSRDYLAIKVNEFNPKNKGKTNANIDKILTESGGLYPALNKVFSPDATNQTHTKVTSAKTVRKPLSSFVK